MEGGCGHDGRKRDGDREFSSQTFLFCYVGGHVVEGDVGVRDLRPRDDCARGSAGLCVERYATGGRGEGVLGEESAAAVVGEVIERREISLGTKLEASSKLVIKKKTRCWGCLVYII